jgi:hypothetical protein
MNISFRANDKVSLKSYDNSKDEKESNESDYDEDKDQLQLEEEQEERLKQRLGIPQTSIIKYQKVRCSKTCRHSKHYY